MPAFKFPDQIIAPRPGTATNPGLDRGRNRTGADFGQWMMQTATRGAHPPAATDKPVATKDSGQPQKESVDSSALDAAPPTADEPGKSDAENSEAPQKDSSASDETEVFPEIGTTPPDSLPQPPLPPGWALPQAAAPLMKLPAEVAPDTVNAGPEELAPPDPGDSSAPLFPGAVAPRNPGTAGMADAGPAKAGPADSADTLRLPEFSPQNPPLHKVEGAAPESSGTAGLAMPLEPQPQAAPTSLASEMAGVAAPLARETAATLAEQPAALRLPPHAEPHRQIADAIVRTSSGQVEVMLDPVELGRVTVLLGVEGNPDRLALLVERPETLELIRRHSDQLLRDLRENGMPGARLEDLRQDDSGSRRDNLPRPPGTSDPTGSPGPALSDPATGTPARPVALGRLDIRF